MATSSTIAALEAYLDKRFSAFEDRTCLLLCQISMGQMNRETKRDDRLTRYIRDLMDRVAALEHPYEHPDRNRLPFDYKACEDPHQRSFARTHLRSHYKASSAA